VSRNLSILLSYDEGFPILDNWYNYSLLKSMHFSRPYSASNVCLELHPPTRIHTLNIRLETLKCISAFFVKMRCWLLLIWISVKSNANMNEPTFLNTHQDQLKLWMFLSSGRILHTHHRYLWYTVSPLHIFL
jgi:hypothetical protein